MSFGFGKLLKLPADCFLSWLQTAFSRINSTSSTELFSKAESFLYDESRIFKRLLLDWRSSFSVAAATVLKCVVLESSSQIYTCFILNILSSVFSLIEKNLQITLLQSCQLIVYGIFSSGSAYNFSYYFCSFFSFVGWKIFTQNRACRMIFAELPKNFGFKFWNKLLIFQEIFRRKKSKPSFVT